MNVIDITAINHNERQVIVLIDLMELFRGPISEARALYPDAFSDSPAESSPAAAPAPRGSQPSSARPAFS